MKRYLEISLVISVALLIAMSANAQHLVPFDVIVDNRAYPEFIYGRGGPEGHSGAYIQIGLGVTEYRSITEIKAKAVHVASGFEISLTEADRSCLGVSPPGNLDQFYAWLRPQDWMTGEWKLVLSYKEGRGRKTETATVGVGHFNFPPVPTGIEIAEANGKKYLVWNSIGAPGTSGVEYRLDHYSKDIPQCPDEYLPIRPGGEYPYELWSGNRIAVPLRAHWTSGDRVRIENWVTDDNSPYGPYRRDRALRDVFLP